MIRSTGIVRLVRDPELRDAGGTPVCNMRVAFNTRRKVGGEWTEVGNFIDAAAFGRTAELCAQYLAKGREVFVDGRLEIREWEQEGEKRSAPQIVLDQVKFIGSKGESGSDVEPSSGSDSDVPF